MLAAVLILAGCTVSRGQDKASLSVAGQAGTHQGVGLVLDVPVSRVELNAALTQDTVFRTDAFLTGTVWFGRVGAVGGADLSTDVRTALAGVAVAGRKWDGQAVIFTHPGASVAVEYEARPRWWVGLDVGYLDGLDAAVTLRWEAWRQR